MAFAGSHQTIRIDRNGNTVEIHSRWLIVRGALKLHRVQWLGRGQGHKRTPKWLDVRLWQLWKGVGDRWPTMIKETFNIPIFGPRLENIGTPRLRVYVGAILERQTTLYRVTPSDN